MQRGHREGRGDGVCSVGNVGSGAFCGVELKVVGPGETGKHGSWSLGLGHWESEGGAPRGRAGAGRGRWTPGRRWSARQALLCPLRRRTELTQEAKGPGVSKPCRVTSLEVGGTRELHVLGPSLAGSEVGQGGGQSRLSTAAGPLAICRWHPNGLCVTGAESRLWDRESVELFLIHSLKAFGLHSFFVISAFELWQGSNITGAPEC